MMTPDQAMDLVWDWGGIFIIACALIAFGVSFIRDAFKGE